MFYIFYQLKSFPTDYHFLLPAAFPLFYSKYIVIFSSIGVIGGSRSDRERESGHTKNSVIKKFSHNRKRAERGSKVETFESFFLLLPFVRNYRKCFWVKKGHHFYDEISRATLVCEGYKSSKGQRLFFGSTQTWHLNRLFLREFPFFWRNIVSHSF